MVEPRGNRCSRFTKKGLQGCTEEGRTVCVVIVLGGIKVFDFGILGLGGGCWCLRIVVIEVILFKPSEAKVSPDDDDQLCKPALTIFLFGIVRFGR